MSQRSQIVTFYLTCSEPRAWLVITADKKESRVFEMWNGYPNHWSASAWLTPGEYRCRFYVGDDRCIVYHGPARVDGKSENALDGCVSVEAPCEGNALVCA